MKFADIEGERCEAQPGASATCPRCGATVTAKCGDLREWHWAHRGIRDCDHWWEPETEWHKNWKDQFSSDWQEIVHSAANGEKHVADVKTQRGTVIEFQHSFLKTEERTAREAFYREMVWVVNGRRRKRDAEQLLKCIGPCVFAREPFILFSADHQECALLRDWNSSSAPVYFDLGLRKDGKSDFWRRDPISRNGRIYLTPVSRESFLKAHRDGPDTEKIFSEGVRVIVEGHQRASQPSQVLPPIGFHQHRVRRRRFPRF